MTKRFGSTCMAVSALAWLILSPGAAQAQSPGAATPQFEVSSVKLNIAENDADSKMSTTIPDRFVATDTPLIFIVLYAYDRHGYDLVGEPEWIHDKAFDIVGIYPAPHPTEPQIRAMLQKLLADRFGLKVHAEQRDIPAYDLVVARKDGRLGPQLLKSNVDCVAWKKEKHNRSQVDAGGPSPVSSSGKRPECRIDATRRWLSGGAVPIHDLLGPLGVMVSKPIVDKTGLGGAYDIDLQWDPTGLAVEPAKAGTSEAPTIFTAVEEQLGLKLVPHKEKFDVVVVDAIKLPDAN
jgi:uncharacterized protein (TIGR03435 family)